MVAYHNPWIPAEAVAVLRGESGTILDVGGSAPYWRASHILDIQQPPPEQLALNCWGYDEGEREQAQGREWSAIPYTTLDLCDGSPWPFADRAFDLGLCSHTLEDIRDPLPACRELARVCKRVLIIGPSRLIDHVRGIEHPRLTGFSHHVWVVFEADGELVFRRKSPVFELPGCHIRCPAGYTLRRELGAMYHLTDRLRVRMVDWLPDDSGECVAFVAPYRGRRDLFVPDPKARGWRQRVWRWKQRMGWGA